MLLLKKKHIIEIPYFSTGVTILLIIYEVLTLTVQMIQWLFYANNCWVYLLAENIVLTKMCFYCFLFADQLVIQLEKELNIGVSAFRRTSSLGSAIMLLLYVTLQQARGTAKQEYFPSPAITKLD